MLSKAIRLATELYDGRKRKFTGLPYIVHPLSVMAQVKNYRDDDGNNAPEYVLAASVLYDPVYRENVSLDSIERLFNKDIEI
jgi:(p)ppGpp synthase/HD superfamily hydrolase